MFQVFNAGCLMFKSFQSSVNLRGETRNVRLRRKNKKKRGYKYHFTFSNVIKHVLKYDSQNVHEQQQK